MDDAPVVERRGLGTRKTVPACRAGAVPPNDSEGAVTQRRILLSSHDTRWLPGSRPLEADTGTID